MPSAYSSIDTYGLSLLKEAVERRFGFAVRTKTDCDKLADLIEARTKKCISVNTLRRFFAVMSSDSNPSLETLNVLANYCGFTDFYEFRQTVVFEPTHEVSNLSVEAINDLQQTLGDSGRFYTTFNWLMLLAFREGNIGFLKNLFHTSALQQRNDYPRKELRTLMFSFSNWMRNDQRLSKQLVPHYAKQPEAQQLYFEWFVDYDYLNLSHHHAISAYSNERHDDEAQLFSLCLLFLHHFWLMNKNGCRALIDKINSIQLRSEMHPFPMGRKLACNILFNSFFNHGLSISFKSEIESWEKQLPKTGALERNLPSFHLMVTEAFSMAGLHEEVFRYIDLAQKRYSFELTEYSKGIVIPLKLYYAKALSETNRKFKANQIVRSIDPMTIDDYNREYYRMIYHQIIAATAERESSDFIKSTNLSKEIARRHRFLFFEKAFSSD